METITPIPCGPLLEETRVTAGLDYYKPTMSQLQYEKQPDAEVTFTFKNRGTQRLADYVRPEALQARLDTLASNGWAPEEIDYFRTLKNAYGEPVFASGYLDYLSQSSLPGVEITLDEETNDLAVQTTGSWPLVTFWETVIMSEVNEAYFEGMVRDKGLDIMAVYDEGDRRLGEKIAILQANPDIKFAEFGTRRHFSIRWQKHVDERILKECPQNLIGISNVALAQSLGVKPSGTFAHEMFMVYCGIADATGFNIEAAHSQLLDDWYETYGPDLAIALTDTYGSDFFFRDFTADQAEEYRALRHDSGDPVEFGIKAMEYYKEMGIDPMTKTIVFSDGLDIDTIIDLYNRFKGSINVVFGWGTTLTNDLGLPALNIVMKATHVRIPETGEEAELVKLSDVPGKHTGPEEKVKEYETIFARTPVVA